MTFKDQHKVLSIEEYLKEDPFIEFYKDGHKYYDLKKKRIVPRSISDIKGKINYTSSALEEGIRRGNIVHEACNRYVETKDTTLALSHAGKYKSYVEHFINAKFWDEFDVVVSEFMLIDRKYDIAGTLDLILKNKKTGGLVLADIKTGSASKAKIQLGGYLYMLYGAYPKIKIDYCQIIFAHETECTRKRFESFDCFSEYEACRSLYFEKQLQW